MQLNQLLSNPQHPKAQKKLNIPEINQRFEKKY